ncbi:peptidoglycan DD-metalloendopeptidase family protein [Shewanella sp. Isolate11]|uniref:peptidoglycan DD-metalloendopeptidase family protein n=1 Tax=Shewanella sp. Isolate11 TaxID=2908530 RepID=UPI001EFC9F49|nr:peptidoglycan DD-metalloendopeptidase family protein [Shewanella sp. Isolate11]MCG9696061.1 peptidoglycan DD-metalloendopeptidase family protein [Shewanella sp. Isolate11]
MLLIGVLISGCSFQAQTPAPVVSLNSPVKKTYHRGGLTSEQYKVRKGDTLYSISWAANKDFVDIANNNGLKQPYTIYPGQVLNLNFSKSKSNRQKTDLSKKNQTKVATKNTNNVKKQLVKSTSSAATENTIVAKKSLDQYKKPAYSETTSQQNINEVIHKPHSVLPNKVYKWHWPVKGKLISRFSANEQGNKGIKIAGSRGDRIKAAADGRVVYAGNALRGYGNLVIIKHSDDYLSAYAHADKILVKEKQFVTAGQTVASMGNTGTNQVMLHFEIRYHGKSVDPLKYLPKT